MLKRRKVSLNFVINYEKRETHCAEVMKILCGIRLQRWQLHKKSRWRCVKYVVLS